jgi:hypothetical protein
MPCLPKLLVREASEAVFHLVIDEDNDLDEPLQSDRALKEAHSRKVRLHPTSSDTRTSKSGPDVQRRPSASRKMPRAATVRDLRTSQASISRSAGPTSLPAGIASKQYLFT